MQISLRREKKKVKKIAKHFSQQSEMTDKQIKKKDVRMNSTR